MWADACASQDFSKVTTAISQGTAVLVTDGSYNRKVRSDLDSAGWLLYCRKEKKILLTVSFYEVCRKAGSYRGELLGLLSIHTFLAAVEGFYGITCHSNCTIACDNLGALNKAKSRRKKIPAGAKHADIRRALRRCHHKLLGKPQYQHVYGHQDDRKRWEHLSLLERLNCICDNQAKAALLRGIMDDASTTLETQRLPLEAAAVYYKGEKITGECGAEIRYQLGRKTARRFYLEELGWPASRFDAVDWEARDAALAKTTDMFRLWLCKQCSSFCATGRNMGRWFGSEITQCPNCEAAQEDSAHLLHCPDPGRSSYFREECQHLQSWLLQEHTDPVLGAALGEYIASRGSITLRQALGRSSDRQLLRLADQQDVIGWDNMMEGKIALLLRDYQGAYLTTSSSMLTSSDWVRQFIQKLLHITHGQWIYRNVSKHHSRHGLLKDLERRSLLREIDQYMSVSPEEVPEESRFLLEIDFQQIRTAATESQAYWVHAMRAAVKAGRRVPSGRRKRRRVSVSGAESTDHVEFIQGIDEECEAQGGGLAAAGSIVQGSGSINDKTNKRKRPD